MPHSFIVARGPFKGCMAIPLTVSIAPIYQADENSCPAVSQPQLVALNAKAIKRGFSRTLWPEKIAKLPAHLFFPVSAAYDHTSREGFRNVRLMLTVGPHVKNLHSVTLDITHKDWQEIKKSIKTFSRSDRRRAKRLVG